LSESDPQTDEYVDTEKLLQIVNLLTPASLLPKKYEVGDKSSVYTSKAKALSQFGQNYEIAHGDKETLKTEMKAVELYQFALQIGPSAWQLYREWQQHVGFLTTGIRNGISRKEDGSIREVSDGILFPIIAAFSNCVEQIGGKWSLVIPPLLKDSEVLSIVKSQFTDVNRSNPNSMGRNKSTYQAFDQLVRAFVEAEKRVHERLMEMHKNFEQFDSAIEKEAPSSKITESERKESTAIKNLAYNMKTKDLTITFQSGQAYRYRQIPRNIAMKLKAAPSLGKAFNDLVKGHYDSERLEMAVR
jgi:hypothetical protein